MFYGHFILAKKGPLARIWLAAHWDKKLTKAHVFETNIESSVEGILQPKVKMALRTSGHLLLGIVRIYSRKAKYLLADCNEAFIKIKIAFRPGVVDLPEANREAAVATITLPEVFHDFDSAMPEIDVDAPITLNQSRAEDITLKEDYGTLNLIADDNFGDMSFDDPEMARDATNIDEGFDHASLLLGEDRVNHEDENQIAKSSKIDLDEPSTSHKDNEPKESLKDHEFDRVDEVDGLMNASGGAGLFEPGDLFDDAPLGHVSVPMETSGETSAIGQPALIERENPDESDDDDMYDMGPASMGCPSPPSSPGSPAMPDEPLPSVPEQGVPEDPLSTLPGPDMERNMLPPPINLTEPPLGISVPSIEMPPPPFPQMPMPQEINKPPAIDQTTLIHNEEESFALVPVDSTAPPVGGVERAKTKRKRKLIVDEVKNISGEEMKSQLSDTTDIVTTLDLAPPTKRLMHWKETGGVEKLFALPGRPLLSKTLSKLYQRHLVTRPIEHEVYSEEEPPQPFLGMDEDTEQMPEEDIAPIQHPAKRRRTTLPVEDDLSMHSLMPHQIFNAHQNDASMSMPGPSNSGLVLPPPIQLPPLQPELARAEVTPNVPLVPPIRINLSKNRITTPDPSLMNISQPQQNSINEHQLPMPTQPETTLPNSFMYPPIDDHTLQSIPPPVHDQSSLDITIARPEMDETIVTDNTVVQLQQPLVPDERVETPRPILEANVEEEANERLQEETHKLPSLDDDETTQNVPVTPYEPEPPVVDPADDFFAQHHKEMENNIVNCNNTTDIDETRQNLLENENHVNQINYDDDDDYGAPASVGLPDEQAADETYEQFEERIISKRTTHMMNMIQSRLDNHAEVDFHDLVRGNNRKQVAQKFYTFLVLKKQQAVELQQDEPYGTLVISRGAKYSATAY